MKLNENNTWLEEIRDGMLDFQAVVPTNGWERVSLALPDSRKNGVARRWWYAAASALLCVCLGGVYLFFDNHSRIEMAESVTTDRNMNDIPSSKANIEMQGDEGKKSLQQQYDCRTITHKHLSDNITSATNVFAPGVLVIEAEDSVVVTSPVTEEKDVEGRDSMPSSARNVVPDMLFNATAQSDESSMHRHLWSLGINVGGHGSLLDVGMDNNSGIYSDASSDKYWGAFPGEAKDDVIESKNHTSWSIGLSVARELTPQISLETGLVFSSLSSDVRQRISGVQKQKIQYLGVPLRVNYCFGGLDSFLFYAGGGVMIERTLSASRGGKRIDVNSWEFSSGISVGGQYKVSRNIFFYIEPGLNWYMNKNYNVPTLRSESPVYLNMKGGIRLSY